jgi:serine/threonine protein kinase/Tol biopolymer transport system component
MKPDRWQQIDQLFHSTLEWPPSERTKVLSESCGGDEDLHREVESLLLAHERETDFLDIPALEVSTEFFAECLAGVMTGQQIGPYKVLSVLGIGGMGEVYLALDSRLGRKIALKLLTPDFARDHQRALRFEQEARAASALNHPNVCVIHEIAETKDGRHFIAMEHIEGITLRERIARGPLNVREALHLADQIGAALAAAHAAGVLHRDIKPENIMLRKDGYVKVLDFGLAKLSEPESHSLADTSAKVSNVHTEPGMQMGTVKYMSPEQLREGPVDGRTDVWSLGVVLYEMVTGSTPFEAGSRNEIIASILKRHPAPLPFPEGVPADFQKIIERAISNEREARYQTMNALAADLRLVRERLGADGTGAPTSITYEPSPDVQRTSPIRNRDAGQTSVLWSSALTLASRTAGQVFSEIKERPRTTVLAAMATVLVLFFGLNWIRSRGQQQAISGVRANAMSRLTNGGHAIFAAISPDGKSFAHVEKKGGKQELLVTNILTADASVVIAASDVFYRGLMFSPDGTYLYFTQTDQKNDSGILYQINLRGGAPRRILDGVDSPVSFNSAGSKFSFVRLNTAEGEYALMTANSDGSDERVIASRREGNALSLGGPAWSPDDQTIVCGAGWWNGGFHMNLVAFAVEGGQEKAINRQQWFSISQIAWSKDKSALIFSAQEQPVSPNQLWRVSYPLGESARITNDVTDYTGVSLSHGASRIVSVGRYYKSQIWVAPEGDAGRARSIANRVGVWSYGLAWTSNGKIVSSAMAGKNLNISLLEADGSKQTQLTVNAGDNYTPATSPDGRFIVFASNRTGQFNIWRMNADDGSDPIQITFSDGNFYPSASSDSQWITYENQSQKTLTVWKVPMAGGVPVQLSDKYSRMPVVAPDNQSIALRYYIQEGRKGIAIIPMQGGAPTKLLPIPIVDWQKVQWTSDGRALTYIETLKGVSNLWSYDISSGDTRQITTFTADEIFSYAWSPDYKQLVCERGAAVSDVTVLDDP